MKHRHLCGSWAFAAMLAVGAGGHATPAQAASDPSISSAEAELDALANDPDSGLIWAIKRLFPKDYLRFRLEYAKYVMSDKSDEEIYELSGRLSREFVTSHAEDAAAAPDEALLKWADAQAALATALQAENVQACADFLYGKIKSEEMSPDAQALVRTAGVRMVETIRAGIDQPTPRGRENAEEDLKAYMQAMLDSGASLETLQRVASTTDSPPKLVCQVSVASYRAYSKLPRAQAARTVSDMILAGKRAAAAGR